MTSKLQFLLKKSEIKLGLGHMNMLWSKPFYCSSVCSNVWSWTLSPGSSLLQPLKAFLKGFFLCLACHTFFHHLLKEAIPVAWCWHHHFFFKFSMPLTVSILKVLSIFQQWFILTGILSIVHPPAHLYTPPLCSQTPRHSGYLRCLSHSGGGSSVLELSLLPDLQHLSLWDTRLWP